MRREPAETARQNKSAPRKSPKLRRRARGFHRPQQPEILRLPWRQFPNSQTVNAILPPLRLRFKITTSPLDADRRLAIVADKGGQPGIIVEHRVAIRQSFAAVG